MQVDTLKLGWCKLGVDGARHVSDLLMMSSHLVNIDLRGNNFGNDGAIVLGRGLRNMDDKKLAELDLGYNEIKDDGACSLAQVSAHRFDGLVLACGIRCEYQGCRRQCLVKCPQVSGLELIALR